ncbi:MAG: MobA/MobL family protein [Nitrospira sp.]|nr:MobA/MobL family protein [Nitrospira sp.]
MASYHCTVRVGGKGKAAVHAAYLAREGPYQGRHRYEDLEATAHGNMPAWAAHNPAHLWQAADEHERANGATYREIEVALPRELGPAQRRALVEAFVAEELGARHAYQWAIHTPPAALERGAQPHAHIMYSERTRDDYERDPAQYFRRYHAAAPQQGGCRKDSAGTADRLAATRQRWAEIQNQHLARHGHAARVDHRSLQARGLDRQPERHLGPSRVQGLSPHEVVALLARRAAEGELERACQQVSLLDRSGNLATAQAVWTERQRLERLTSRELAQEMARLRPRAIRELVEDDPAVRHAAQETRTLEAQVRAAQVRAAHAVHEAQRWREDHPLRATAHDAGAFQSAYLVDRARVQEDARQEQARVAPHLAAAEHREQLARRAAAARLTDEHRPVQEKLTELEEIQQAKVSQDRAAEGQRRVELARTEAAETFRLLALKRQLGMHGFHDQSPPWQATPPALRQLVDQFNRQSAAVQAALLARLRDDPQVRAQMADLLQQRSRALGRGRSR